MRIRGSVNAAVHDLVSGPVQSADWLGAGDAALYLISRSSTVLAVVTRDAVRLPCAVVLPRTAAELPLTALARASGFGCAIVGNGQVSWAGPAGRVRIECAQQWSTPVLTLGTPIPTACDYLRRAIAHVNIGLEPARVAALVRALGTEAQASAAAGLLGRGPGLTPSGDDVLAGFLIGTRAFGRPAHGVLHTVTETATAATTALSAQLLRDAARGECVAQLAEIVRGLVTGSLEPSAVRSLLAVGHTSGAALAHGLLAAAASCRLATRTVGAQPPAASGAPLSRATSSG